MYHNFFIYSSVDGHLGCFHVLAIALQWTMGYMRLFQFWFPRGTCLGVELLGHMMVFIPSFFFNIFLIFIFTLFCFTVLYWFCHTLTWISHWCTWVPNPEPPLPPRTPYHLSGSSLCTSPKHPVFCIEHRLATSFWPDSIHVSMPFSQIIPPSPSPTEAKSPFYTSVSLLLSRIEGYHYHFSKFHIFVLVYCIGVFLSGLLHSV